MTTPALLVLLFTAAAAPGQEPARPSIPASQGPMASSRLEGVHWRLTRLRDTDVVVKDVPREPHLVFHAGGTLSGADGCNAIRSRFDSTDESLTIHAPLMGTLVSCTLPGALDRGFRDALLATRAWRVREMNLELLDEKGTVLARFVAGVP